MRTPYRHIKVYRKSYDTAGVTVSLDAVIRRIQSGDKRLDEKTRYCHATAHTAPQAYKRYKEKNLPAVTFSGVFPPGKRKAQHLLQHSGLVTLDIDDLEANTIPDLLAELAQLPQVVLAFVSPSGTGIKVIVSVNPIPRNDLAHKGAYQACLDFFDDLATEYGFEIDTSGKDCSRLCYLAHDPLAIVHKDAPPIEWDAEAWLEEERKREAHAERKIEEFSKLPVDIKVLDYIPRDVPYEDWRNIGMAIKHAGLPLSVWRDWNHGQRLSSSSGWIKEDLNRYWASFKRTGITWGTVVHLATQHGYTPPKRTKAKLHQTPDTDSEPTETLEANRDHRDAAADTFLTDTPTPKTVHIQLVKDITGAGKDHTYIGKAYPHDKRTLIRTQTIALAEQAVNDAIKLGFKNPQHLLGREHNWNASGIEQIPVENRTADLFEKNNCIMVDEVKTYTDKRLAPRTYCEHRCEFRDGCPHLAQYEGLGQRDFIASSSPNLLFDLNLRGYLQSLVTATDEPSDEELAIDAILGAESEATQAFDFAILNDYDLNGLYTDITLSKSEFKRLQKAWKGTPTADFAQQMRKAFKKKKPHAIVKQLRKAFESTAEHHETIATHLTQHARIGTVKYIERPKHSKETERLLTEKQVRYTDGGTQFIPVDIHAYKELTDKGIPTVPPHHLETEQVGEQVRVPHTPTHALLAGVPLEALTPLWQKGATPIELLQIFLASIGNDKNAPIRKAYRPGETPDPVLTFSIPPQAPVGILPHIAMLSATTDPADVQRSFDGQPVTFSVHTGGRVEHADGVRVYQFTDARMTSASVFEYPKDADGKRKLQEPPSGLTPTAEKRLAKLNDWAKAADGTTAFVSYKEFTEAFAAAVDGFDIVTHFDKVVGLNFDGLKYLVVFGYPKVKHEIVIEHARKQYAADSEPLPKAAPDLKDEKGNPVSEYIQLTDEVTSTENGITSTERRYKDARLEKVRQQLSTDKLQQAIGRIRLVTWTDTETIIFTSAPVPGITERATLFSTAAFNLSETPNALSAAMDRIQKAEETGDVKGVMETKQVSQRTAERQTKPQRDKNRHAHAAQVFQMKETLGMSLRAIERELGISRNKINKLLDEYKAVQKRQGQLINLIGNVANAPPSEAPVVTGKSKAERNAEIHRRHAASDASPDATHGVRQESYSPKPRRYIERFSRADIP